MFGMNGWNKEIPGGDSISRAAPIDAVAPFDDEYRIRDAIEDLPAAQPETHDKRAEMHTCDLISRQAAIDVDGLDEEIRCEMCRNPMHTDRGCDGHCEYDEKLYERIMQILDERIKPLPSVTPKQRTGKWIKLDMHRGMADHKCTACGQECYVPTCMGEPLYAFCPNCGSYNGGEQDE